MEQQELMDSHGVLPLAMTTENKAHCKIGPSSLPARAVCPCYDSAPGDASAQSGTRSHAVVEAYLTAQGPEAFMEGTTDDEAARGLWGAKKIMELCNHLAPGSVIRSEVRAQYRGGDFDNRDFAFYFGDKFGTCDAHWEYKDEVGVRTLFIADYKTYSKENSEKDYRSQLMMYAVLLASMYGKEYEQVRGFIVAAGDHTVTDYFFTLDDARKMCLTIIKNVEAVQGGALFHSHEAAARACGRASVWCSHCRHASTCPAVSRAVEAVQTTTIQEKPLAVRMALLPVIEAFVKNTKAKCRAELDAGRAVVAVSKDGETRIEYALAERKGSAKLTDLRGLAQAAAEYGVPSADFTAAVSISKTAVEGLFKSADEAKIAEAAARGETLKISKKEREQAYLPFFGESPIQKYVKRIS